MALDYSLVPRHWWAFAVRGAAAVIFGILAFAWPGLTLTVLVALFGAFALINGVATIISAIRSQGDRLWLPLLEGALGIVVGVVVFSLPGLSALVLLYWIAAWAIVIGVLESISAVRLRGVIEHDWTWIISGLLSVIFGVILIAQPGAGALAVVWIIGIYAVLFGVSLFVLAWRVRELEQSDRGHPGGAGVPRPVAP